MRWTRLMRHLLLPDWWAMRAFPKSSLRVIEGAIAACERKHRGELRFVVEAGLPLAYLLRERTPRQRAVELFAGLGVWDTENNSGVLIYVQLLDRRIEIVADRGINARVGASYWTAVCRRLEAAFSAHDQEQGIVRALGEISVVLAEHFPAAADNDNELPNAPLLL